MNNTDFLQILNRYIRIVFDNEEAFVERFIPEHQGWHFSTIIDTDDFTSWAEGINENNSCA